MQAAGHVPLAACAYRAEHAPAPPCAHCSLQGRPSSEPSQLPSAIVVCAASQVFWQFGPELDDDQLAY